MRGLKGKNVLVTGGASGIGQAAATCFLEEGCAVCVLDRSAEARSRVTRELPELAGVIDADVSSLERITHHERGRQCHSICKVDIPAK